LYTESNILLNRETEAEEEEEAEAEEVLEEEDD
jgi:hypothetical protein